MTKCLLIIYNPILNLIEKKLIDFFCFLFTVIYSLIIKLDSMVVISQSMSNCLSNDDFKINVHETFNLLMWHDYTIQIALIKRLSLTIFFL